MINLTGISNINCCGAIDNALTSHVGGPGFDFSCWNLFLLFFLFFFVKKTYFHFLTDLNIPVELLQVSFLKYSIK